MVVDISSDPFFQGRPGIRMFPGLCFFGVLYISAVPLFQARPRRSGCCLGSAFSGAAGGLVYFLGSDFSGLTADADVSWVMLCQAWPWLHLKKAPQRGTEEAEERETEEERQAHSKYQLLFTVILFLARAVEVL